MVVGHGVLLRLFTNERNVVNRRTGDASSGTGECVGRQHRQNSAMSLRCVAQAAAESIDNKLRQVKERV